MSAEKESPGERRKSDRASPQGGKVKVRLMPFTPKEGRVQARGKKSFLGLLGKAVEEAGDLLDISNHGLRFVSSQKLAQDVRLKLTVIFSGGRPTLDCTGSVRWTHVHTKQGEFAVGVEFDALTEEQLALLSRVKKTML